MGRRWGKGALYELLQGHCRHQDPQDVWRKSDNPRGRAMNRNTWNDLQFYESSDVLKEVARKHIGFEMNSGQAEDIRACLYQAREYYRSSSDAGITVKPLLLFYGMSDLAKAITMLLGGKERSRLHRLPASHGLDFIGQFSSLEEASCTIPSSGTFQGFNDSIALNGKVIHGPTYRWDFGELMNSTSRGLKGVQLSLRDLWACMPALDSCFSRTFDSHTTVVPARMFVFSGGYWSIVRDESLSDEHWSTVVCRLADFVRKGSPPTEQLITLDDSKVHVLPACWLTTAWGPTGHRGLLHLKNPSVPPLAPLSSMFIAMFILSSIVRYKPGEWVAIARLGRNDRPLAYAVEFIDWCEDAFVSGILDLITRGRADA